MTVISLGNELHPITITLDGTGFGKLTSNLPLEDGSVEYDAAISGMESLLLALACRGVDLDNQKVRDAVEQTLATIANEY